MRRPEVKGVARVIELTGSEMVRPFGTTGICQSTPIVDHCLPTSWQDDGRPASLLSYRVLWVQLPVSVDRIEPNDRVVQLGINPQFQFPAGFVTFS